MSETKLLPCPFCGGEAMFRPVGYTVDLHPYSRVNEECGDVECTKCHIRTPFKVGKSEAVKSWNTRKPIDRILERLEDMYQPCYLCREDRCAIDRAIEIVKEEVRNEYGD